MDFPGDGAPRPTTSLWGKNVTVDASRYGTVKPSSLLEENACLAEFVLSICGQLVVMTQFLLND